MKEFGLQKLMGSSSRNLKNEELWFKQVKANFIKFPLPQ